jgi:hypothetical protein
MSKTHNATHGAPFAAVFDRGRNADPHDETRGFLRGFEQGNLFVPMRRTDRDRKARGRDITARLLGDPAPGRSAQDQLNAQKTQA